MYKITFTHKGYVVAVVYRNDGDAKKAALQVPNTWSTVRVEEI